MRGGIIAHRREARQRGADDAGWTFLDALSRIVVGGVILKWSTDLRSAAFELLDVAPSSMGEDEIRRTLEAIDDVREQGCRSRHAPGQVADLPGAEARRPRAGRPARQHPSSWSTGGRRYPSAGTQRCATFFREWLLRSSCSRSSSCRARHA